MRRGVGVCLRNCFDGDLRFRGGLRIDGHVYGNVMVEKEQHGYLVLGEHGKIDGAVRCTHLIVNGEVVIEEGGELTGQIEAGSGSGSSVKTPALAPSSSASSSSVARDIVGSVVA